MQKISFFFKREVQDFRMLLRSVPAPLTLFFVCSVIFMNLFANKELGLGLDWFAADCGLFVSWIFFLCMDMIVKRFGPRASIQMSVFAMFVNLLFALLCFLISLIPGNWGEFYTYGNSIVNDALNQTIGGTWYVLLGSSIAFLVSSVCNALMNAGIAKWIHSKGFLEFALRSYISTFLAQFIDNILFAEIVSANFFGWTQLQCVVCALTGAVAELLCEVLFSWVGYSVVRKWEKDGTGSEYLEYMRKREVK